MAQVNESYGKLQAGYLFPEIGRRVQTFQDSHPDAAIIRLGSGGASRPSRTPTPTLRSSGSGSAT
jgi:LL-diaminopimelate aminotransferase